MFILRLFCSLRHIMEKKRQILHATLLLKKNLVYFAVLFSSREDYYLLPKFPLHCWSNIHFQLFQYGLVFVFLTRILFNSLIILTTCDLLFICKNMPDTMYAQSMSYYMLVLRYSNSFRLRDIRNWSLFLYSLGYQFARIFVIAAIKLFQQIILSIAQLGLI